MTKKEVFNTFKGFGDEKKIPFSLEKKITQKF